ncbi:hypothetical protein AKJ41_03485 [candidate division MSBL1 archaeon SCGC-AAA259O05]|uniref:Uncharacterized protein n=1 Tax=candidate division MSBL1 archaeon SCGC-AAA259O05 TaxID=1698271 RepID=A0A133V398_9EURY|nr:hypothetical protein AKJ41_03485 [candidate division MSBL1 archaeon SCGC-AAA259O05]
MSITEAGIFAVFTVGVALLFAGVGGTIFGGEEIIPVYLGALGSLTMIFTTGVSVLLAVRKGQTEESQSEE